jgi:lysozyme
MSEELKNQLIRHEGLELKCYEDPVGKMTIGVGRNLDDMGITHHEAMYLLQNDIDRSKFELMTNIPFWNKLSDIRKEVLINMCFNLGITRLKTFKKMFLALEMGDYDRASSEALDSRWARQVKGRAMELAKQMKEDKRTTDI